MRTLEAEPLADSGIILRRLSQYAEFSPEELAILNELGNDTEKLPAGSELIVECEPMNRPRLLLSGWGCRFRMLADGRRQIFEFILPGDMYGMCHRPQAIALSNAITLTPCVIADASPLGEAVLERPQDYPGLTAACAMTASLDEAYLLNQLMRVGRQTAYERLAHLFLEVAHRLSVVGLADGERLSMPLTQEIIADAMGLSVVHLNRTLQQLRRDKLIEFKNGSARILQPDRLAAIGDFHVPRVTGNDFARQRPLRGGTFSLAD
ncbi:MAG TPA: Crp/Fnr family transcriptional regulator [Rhizomicrobium sp.]|nr:Crp/Fnr family transcriptional regulator [Rhizomicrobium sp.]